MENIAVVIEKSTGRIVYVTSNSAILPKTEELDAYTADPRYRVVVDVQTAAGGRVRAAGLGGEIVEVPLADLDPSIYRINFGLSADMFIRPEEAARHIGAQLGTAVGPPENEQCLLELTTDAPDSSPLNGVPEIIADGVSTANIFVQKKARTGEPLTGEADNDLVILRTTRGTLSHRRAPPARGRAPGALRRPTHSAVAAPTA